MSTFPLDSSAIVHLASKTRRYTNTFRISVTLNEPVIPHLLQKAVNHTTPRFPMVAAGIRQNAFQYEVVPASPLPQAQPERAVLAPMPDKMLQNCAMRILYRGSKISVEIFHGLTDGHGGLMFLQALVTEYTALAYGISASPIPDTAEQRLFADDYQVYAGGAPVPFQHQRVFQFPNRTKRELNIHTVTVICSIQPLLKRSHELGVSLTALLTAAMASAAAEIQARYRNRHQWKPIQILVPINLRRRFPSSTLRNFTLYALPRVEIDQLWLPVDTLAAALDQQIKAQTSKEYLAGLMSTQTKLQNMPLAVHAPLRLKMGILKLGNGLFGERGSCLTLSNLGKVTFPQKLRPLIRRAEFLLTPRNTAPYNCGVTSYDGKLFINFTRWGTVPELELLFFQQLGQMGIETAVELDGLPVSPNAAQRDTAPLRSADIFTSLAAPTCCAAEI